MADKAKDDAKKSNVTPALILEAVEDLETAKEKVTSATGKYQGRRKHWKSLGVNLKVLDAILTLKRADEADVRSDELDRVRYAAWLNVDLGTQAEFNLEPPPAEHNEKLAKYDTHRAGYNAGQRGDPRSSNPHEPGTVAHPFWDQGWADGDNDKWQGAAPARKPKKGKVGAEMGPKKTAQPDSHEGSTAPGAATPPAEAAEASGDPVPQLEAGSEDAPAQADPLEIAAFLNRNTATETLQ